jgi:hypothetical protein
VVARVDTVVLRQRLENLLSQRLPAGAEDLK